MLEPRKMDKVISLYAAPIEDLQPSDVSVWTEHSPQLAETDKLFTNPWAAMTSPPTKFYKLLKEIIAPVPVTQEPRTPPPAQEVEPKPTTPPPTYCMEVTRYL